MRRGVGVGPGALGLSLAAALVACGQPLIGDAYLGAPVFTTSMRLQDASGDATDLPNARLALLWQVGGPHSLDAATWVEQTASALDVAVPSSFQWSDFEAPGDALLAHDAAGRSLGYGIGWAALYADDNRNRRRDPEERLWGLMNGYVYYYSDGQAPATLTDAQRPTRAALDPGFHVVPVPQPCGAPDPGPTTPGDCGVPLGAHCDDNTACGAGGYCLQQSKLIWPGGYCVVLESPATTCRPGAGVFVHRPMYAPSPTGALGYWLKACRVDADCLREAGPVGGVVHGDARLYTCDRSLGACMPTLGGVMSAGARVEVEPFCSEDVVIPKPPH